MKYFYYSIILLFNVFINSSQNIEKSIEKKKQSTIIVGEKSTKIRKKSTKSSKVKEKKVNPSGNPSIKPVAAIEKIIPPINKNKNITNVDIPEDLILSIKNTYPVKNVNEVNNMCFFVLILLDALEHLNWFTSPETGIKNKYIKLSEGQNTYYRYRLLVRLITHYLENKIGNKLKQQHKIDSLVKMENFDYKVLKLDVTEVELEEIKNLIKKQQSKDFYITNDFKKSITNAIKTGVHQILSPSEILLQGDPLGFTDLPLEYLPLKMLLKKYFVWFLSMKKNSESNTWSVVVILDVTKHEPLTYKEYVYQKQLTLIKNFFHSVIVNKFQRTYTVNGNSLLEVLDEQINELI